MNRVKIKVIKLMAIAAILATSLIPSIRTSTAKNQPSPVTTAVPDADLASEARVIAKYADDLAAYDKQSVELGKRARFVNADLEPLESKSADLKGRLSGVQSSVREIVRKLKAANEWDDLNTPPARITDQGLRSIYQESSFKQLLEESSNGLTGHASEISTPLENLRKRLTSRYDTPGDVQFVRAGYEAPAPFGFVSLRCSINTLKVNIAIRLPSVNPSSQLARETWAACHPGQAYPF